MQFNISHHGEWVILAAESHFAVGCDIMNIDRRRGGDPKTFFRHMKANFSEEEWSEVQSETGGDRGKMTRFMRLWTLKEAYVKAVGMGLSLEPKRVCFSYKWDQDEGCYKRKEGASEEERERWRLDAFVNESKRDPLDEKRRIEAETKELHEGTNHSGPAPVLFPPWLDARVSVDKNPALVGSEVKGLASSTPSHRFAAGAFDTNTIWTVAVGIDGKLLPSGVKPDDIVKARDASLATPFQILDVRTCIGELSSLWNPR
uniref:holo-[acyl-carrier-protein] synthase n=2 Tax=Lotharella oceanica TaxID=641309 RepID=A0A7S2TIJ9_9EUKA|mmetsp:Transcript_1580/g.2983  ORF Transcript_1580/g.2983 Transcript_1580/m.2983 type:complete len:259 (+) Transcript_1580:113-889(+)